MKVRGIAMDDNENAKRGVIAAVGKSEQKQTWNCSVAAILSIGNSGAGFVEDEGGGTPKCIETYGGSKENGQQYQQHTTSTSNAYDKNDDEYLTSSACAAYDGDEAAAAGAVNFNSNRTSQNNSTENLSFSSDNFYSDDLLFFQDDDANGAEVDDISCESDDCVYAYRGDGAELYFPLEAGRPSGVADNSLDDEMDFLEMDFEPDTLSEVEVCGNSVDSDVGNTAVSDALLMSGRHSSSSHMLGSHLRNVEGCVALPIAVSQQRQLFSSPIDDMPAAPLKALQTQTLLGKNFGRMSLHLDQITGPNENLDDKAIGSEDIFVERLNGTGSADTDGSSNINSNRRHIENMEFLATTAHSLPNTLHVFGREQKTHELPVVTHQTSPSKITGAKPKRMSTFSTSSSASSKNSSKSRTSLGRSVIGPSLFNSSSFDERSVSCTEFRSAGVTDANSSSATSTIGLTNPPDVNDDSCLDCLEKEFLANTIGKAIEPSNCPKCRRKRFSFFRTEQQSRCRSGSPSFFSDAGHENFYELPREYINTTGKEWLGNQGVNGHYADIGSLSLLTKQEGRLGCFMPTNTIGEGILIQNAATECDISGKQLLTNTSTDKEVIAISSSEINEEILVRALEHLNVAYNSELLKFYFARHPFSPIKSSNSSGIINKFTKKFKDLKQFILYESKKICNHPELKRLIEAVTNHQVTIQFKENANKTETEVVHVNVADILFQWTRNNNLSNLAELDERFENANILGKIANIVRQTQTKQIASLRPHPNSIAIPQYYPSGFLIIRKKLKP